MDKKSYFRIINNRKAYPKLNENLSCDVLIIGAGLMGLSMAYEMLPYTNDIVIIDQNHIFQNTTSSTTAKITYQHGYIYHGLINEKGLELYGIDLAEKYFYKIPVRVIITVTNLQIQWAH